MSDPTPDQQVEAKFYVAEITRRSYNKGAATVILQPVTRGSENHSWASATPTGKIEMTINNALAAQAFELGEEYTVTFTHAPVSQPPAAYLAGRAK